MRARSEITLRSKLRMVNALSPRQRSRSGLQICHANREPRKVAGPGRRAKGVEGARIDNAAAVIKADRGCALVPGMDCPPDRSKTASQSAFLRDSQQAPALEVLAT